MLSLVRDIPWDDFADSFSAYLTIVITPLTLSISEGISVGFISYSVLKTGEGKFGEVPPGPRPCGSVYFAIRFYSKLKFRKRNPQLPFGVRTPPLLDATDSPRSPDAGSVELS